MDRSRITKVTLLSIITLIERDDGQKKQIMARLQMERVFKVRMVRYAAYGVRLGSRDKHLRWFELAQERWAQVFKTTGTPCSCWMCRGEEYDRKEYKEETRRIIRESME